MSIQLFTTIMNVEPTGYYFHRLEQAQQFYAEAIENDVDMPKAKIRQYTAEMFDVNKSDI